METDTAGTRANRRGSTFLRPVYRTSCGAHEPASEIDWSAIDRLLRARKLVSSSPLASYWRGRRRSRGLAISFFRSSEELAVHGTSHGKGISRVLTGDNPDETYRGQYYTPASTNE